MNSNINSSAESLHDNASAKNSNWGTNTKSIAQDGIHDWQIAFQFHEIGGDRQRETKRSFRSAEEAQAFFGGQAVRFTKMFEHTSNASIEQSESELLIHVDGVQIVRMTYLEVALQCA